MLLIMCNFVEGYFINFNKLGHIFNLTVLLRIYAKISLGIWAGRCGAGDKDQTSGSKMDRDPYPPLQVGQIISRGKQSNSQTLT